MTLHITWPLIFMLIGGLVAGKYAVQFLQGLWILWRWGK